MCSRFGGVKLALGDAPVFSVPQARPPAGLRLSVLQTGCLRSLAALAYRGGSLLDSRVFGMDTVLVQHPEGNLLFDAGLARDVKLHVRTLPYWMRGFAQYAQVTPVADQLGAAGLDPGFLMGVVITHAHIDHVSGISDLPGVPVWISAPEQDFIHSGDVTGALLASFGDVRFRHYDFPDGPYLGFDSSYDVFRDGSVVLVPAPGHTPGSIIAFISLPSGRRYALVGDLAWQKEGIELPAERPWLMRKIVDSDEDNVRRLLVRMHQLKQWLPGLTIVPAHDRRVFAALPAFPASVG